MLDGKVVGNGLAATKQKRIDAVQALAPEFFVDCVSGVDRWEPRLETAKEVLVGVQAL